nr:MAG TPA: Terminase small subunit [Caudoviricetes sp.]
MLTIKQEKFVQNIVKGMSQREAYKSSYNAKNMKDDTIDNKACNLFKQDKIRARYEELLKKIEDKTIMTAEERQIWLSKVVKGDIKITREYDDEIKEYEPYMSDRLKAMDILNKMSGEYTQKIELENEKPFEVNIKVV